MEEIQTPILVIGTGIAGLTAALKLADRGPVMVVCKGPAQLSNSGWAQGGVAAVVDPEDSVDAHVADTLGAGDGLCDEAVVRAVVEEAPARIRDLEQWGVRFAHREDGREGYDLGQEGGHTHRRVLHAGDITGAEIIQRLLTQAQAHPNVTVQEQWMAIDFVTTGWLGQGGDSTCIGAYFLDRKNNRVVAVRAGHTVLASGGAGKVYLYTSNPDVATGDGIAMAWRAGVPIRNMEFVQFHPTCLHHPEERSFLISEALRGEGGVLKNSAGEPFVDRFDPRGSLAPRDIVARAIDDEMKRRGDPFVHLDMTHKPEAELKQRFPNIYAKCFSLGIDMARDPIPVVPAAHYFCGGVASDLDGATALPGLSVIGESSCTGLHGANRLASNSLLEGMVMAHRAADRLRADWPGVPESTIPAWRTSDAVESDELVVVEHNWDEVRTCMWDYVGIVRTDKRLDRALRRLKNLRAEIREYYLDYLVTSDVLELRNIAAVGELIVRCAQERQESRGLHYTLDHTGMRDAAVDTTVVDPPGEHLG